MSNRPFAAAALLVSGALAVTACGPLGGGLSSKANAQPAAGAPASSAVLAELGELPVRLHSAMTGYSREDFGPAWSDDGTVAMGHNHCPTRDDVLSRDMVQVVRKSDGCTVVSGVLHDRYTGKTIRFRRGPGTSLAVQIDHLLPLPLAWVSGAQKLTADQRLNFANDPENLLASDGPTNAAKGAKDAAEWLPPQPSARCWYVSAQVRVMRKYGLSVTVAEKKAITGVLTSCPASGTGPAKDNR
jgi:hypothetical protein